MSVEIRQVSETKRQITLISTYKPEVS